MIAPLWEPARTWLNTASYGLPPTPAWDALQQALVQWRGGAQSWIPWGERAQAARERFGRIVGAPHERIAIGSSAAEMIGTVAASLPPGATVLVAAGEFTSLSWPFAARGDVRVKERPLEELADAIGREVDLVAVSAVQSADGRLADLDAIRAAAQEHDALLCVDGCQAVGWLPLDAAGIDYLVATAYKWLMSPRGTAFLACSERGLERLRPLHANWFAGHDIHSSYYELPVRLARDARRLDTSPGWQAWVGTEAALAVVEELTVEAIHAHDLALANAFRAGLGIEPGDSAIVSLALDDAAAKADALERAGVAISTRAGALRISFHCHNSEDDVGRALEVLGDPRG